MLPASAPPHFPNTSGTGHERGLVVLDQGRQPETPHRDPVAPARCHSHTGESAARGVFSGYVDTCTRERHMLRL